MRSAISVAQWNIHGLLDTFDDVDFIKNIEAHDIVGLCETFTGTDFDFTIPGYCSPFKKCREKCKTNNRYYGGMVLLIRESIKPGVEILNTKGSEEIWIRLKKDWFNLPADKFICFVYIPPAETGHELFDSRFVQLQNSIQCFQNKGDVLILGDLNSRVQDRPDFIEFDEAKHGHDDFDIYTPDRMVGPRVSQDPTFKNGQNLLDLCIANKLRILNGRKLGDLLGNPTYFGPRGTSIIDYALADEHILDSILFFQVHPSMGHISDHCMISLTIQANLYTQNTNVITGHASIKHYRFDDKSRLIFKEHLNTPEITSLITDQLKSKVPIDNIDSWVESINSIFYNIANKTFGPNKIRIKRKKKLRRTIKPKAWHDQDCFSLKKELKTLDKIRFLFPLDKNIRMQYFIKLKTYKETVRRKKRMFKQGLVDQLERLSQTDPNSYWKLVEKLKDYEKKDQTSYIALDSWVDYFKELYSTNTDPAHEPFHADILNELKSLEKSPIFNELNFKINNDEILQAINKLKVSTAAGYDRISGEMIKLGKDAFLPLLSKLFNNIFLSGSYPELWRNCVVTPIFKKGDPYDPNNYRGISVNCTLSKVYNSILNNRLTKFCDKHKLISDSQIGFKKKARTIDHVFVVNTLFESFCKNGKKLYLCFIDFKKAYDSVWRDGLLYKLLKNEIGGLFYSQIKSLYSSDKIYVKTQGNIDGGFSSCKGVKQGDTLSPLLFNLYINEITDIFNNHPDSPILNGRPINCLLYADDLVLISTSKEGLQSHLDSLSSFCIKWKLNVNLSKSKVLIMNRSGRLITDNFSYQGTTLECVKMYPYLGIPITNSFSFNHISQFFKNKGMKAAAKLKRMLLNCDVNKKLSMKLFDQLITPICLYGCELWGLPKVNCKAFTRATTSYKLENTFDNIILWLKEC